ncbi:hypothetical protein EV174_006052, partial [Coemansia sp. RSA 2320]
MLRFATGRLAQHCPSTGAALLARRATKLASKMALVRSISSSHACEGRPRQHADHSRYPRPRSTRPEHPETASTNALMDRLNEPPGSGPDMIDTIRITDEEISKIFESVMSAEQRQERDEQSLRHKSRA